MNIEKQVVGQVTSFELSKKIAELGVSQNSLFHWAVHCDGKDTSIELGKPEPNNACKCRSYSAFTVAELGEKLPTNIQYNGFDAQLKIIHLHNGTWQVSYTGLVIKCKECETTKLDTVVYRVSNTQAEAYAKMLIYLIENKLIDVKEQPKC